LAVPSLAATRANALLAAIPSRKAANVQTQPPDEHHFCGKDGIPWRSLVGDHNAVARQLDKKPVAG